LTKFYVAFSPKVQKSLQIRRKVGKTSLDTRTLWPYNTRVGQGQASIRD